MQLDIEHRFFSIMHNLSLLAIYSNTQILFRFLKKEYQILKALFGQTF